MLLVPYVHGSAHDDHQIEAVKGRNLFALIEFDRLPDIAAFRPKFAEYARMFDGDMLQDQNSQSTSSTAGRSVQKRF
jgi:hypothetical protein